MKRASLFFVLLLVATALGNCQQSSDSIATHKPNEGSFAQNTYRNDFFGFTYRLPEEWHKSRGVPTALPSGACYLLIGDRDTHQSLLNRVMVVADVEQQPFGGLAEEYLSAYVRAQIKYSNAEITRAPSSFIAGGTDFYRADYKRAATGIMVYSSIICTKRNGYWLSWNFVAPSPQDLSDAVNTIQNVSFDPHSPS